MLFRFLSWLKMCRDVSPSAVFEYSNYNFESFNVRAREEAWRNIFDVMVGKKWGYVVSFLTVSNRERGPTFASPPWSFSKKILDVAKMEKCYDPGQKVADRKNCMIQWLALVTGLGLLNNFTLKPTTRRIQSQGMILLNHVQWNECLIKSLT